MKTKLGILGCGNMGSAIALGLVKKSKGFEMHLYDPSIEKSRALAKKTKGKAHSKMIVLKSCDYFLLACKPQHFQELAGQLKPILARDSKIISIMAGIPTSKIRRSLGCKKLARVMPNTPCLIGEGAAAIYCVGMNAKEKTIVKNIFTAVAEVHCVNSDDAIDIVTIGIASGSGYLFEIARIMIKKLTALGLDAKIADPMVKQMLKGSSLLMQQSPNSPETLRNQVTSKGGTTEAALKVFSEKKLEEIFGQALKTAYKRAKEL